MSGYSVSLKKNIIGSELSALYIPRVPDPQRRAVIYAHGANGDGSQTLDTQQQPTITRFFGMIAQAGFVVLSSDWGGPQTHGNNTGLSAMESGWTFLKNSGLCATDKVILSGASMGTLSTHRFAKEHPTEVSGITNWIPFVDIENGRTNDYLALRANINTAWGMPVGSYIGGSDQTPLPTDAKLLSYASALPPIPTHMWYSTGDVISTNMSTYLAARNGSATGHIVSTSLIHTDAAVAAADIASTIDFFNSVA